MPSSKLPRATMPHGRRSPTRPVARSRTCSIATLAIVLLALGCQTAPTPIGLPDQPPGWTEAADASLRRISVSLCVDPTTETLAEAITYAIRDALEAAREPVTPEDFERLDAIPQERAGEWLETQQWCLRDGDPLVVQLQVIDAYLAYVRGLRGDKPPPEPPRPWWHFWRWFR